MGDPAAPPLGRDGSGFVVSLRTVVTGAASGIGQAVAARLRARGDRVIGFDRDIDSSVDPADWVVVDLSDAAARSTAVETATEQPGGIDVLVNVAGVFRSGSLLDSTPADWMPVLELDLHAPLDLMRLCAPGMVRQGFGRILNVTSVHARLAQPHCLAYDVAKAGLEAATRSAALDLGPLGVLANAVAPGFVRTRMSLLDDGRDETETEDFAQRYLLHNRLPLGRGATAQEIGPVIDLLTSSENTYLTGQVVTIDGGLTITF